MSLPLVSRLSLSIVCAVLLVLSACEPAKPLLTDMKIKKDIAANLEKTVVTLSREIGLRNYEFYDNLEKSAEYISAQFKAAGYKAEDMSYEHDKRTYRNIIAEKPGAGPTAEQIIVGAHYDSDSNPGADDNASGVAAMLELSRLLRERTLKAAVKFVAFANEEPPFFRTEAMGSRVYVKRGIKDRKNIKAAIILETIGFYSEKDKSQEYPLPALGLIYPDKGNFIAVVGNFQSSSLVSAIAGEFKKASSLPIECLASVVHVPGTDFSDNWSFWQEKIPAVMITDTAFLRNPFYHTAKDTSETLDYGKMAEVVVGLKAAIEHLARK